MHRWLFIDLSLRGRRILCLGIGNKENVQLAAHSPLAILMVHVQHARIQCERAHQLSRLYIVVLPQRCGSMVDDEVVHHGHRLIDTTHN